MAVPVRVGLYDSEREHDSCGVGFVAHIKGAKSHRIVAQGLEILANLTHRGAVLTRDELLNEVWGYNAMPSTRTVDVHVAWLRQKIEDNPRHPQYVLTVHGLGYKFVG